MTGAERLKQNEKPNQMSPVSLRRVSSSESASSACFRDPFTRRRRSAILFLIIPFVYEHKKPVIRLRVVVSLTRNNKLSSIHEYTHTDFAINGVW